MVTGDFKGHSVYEHTDISLLHDIKISEKAHMNMHPEGLP
jgi:hypothetical protein